MEPLTPAVFHILVALADGEKHGYGIMLEVSETTGGSFVMGPGTLYGTLKRTLESKLIEESGQRQDPKLDDERRRYYRITVQGKAAARAEAKRLEMMMRAASAKGLLKHTRAVSC
jgi:DNA-binding PadR family transcriptional regulator